MEKWLDIGKWVGDFERASERRGRGKPIGSPRSKGQSPRAEIDSMAVGVEDDATVAADGVVKISLRPMVSCSRFHVLLPSFLGFFYNMAVKWVWQDPRRLIRVGI